MGSAAALTVFDDPREKARQLHRLHALWVQTGQVPAGVREVVRRGWTRRPAAAPVGRPILSEHDVQRRRDEHRDFLGVLPLLLERLEPVADEAGCELVVCDAEGVVLEIRGPSVVRRASERLGFVEGACWSEAAVGTNALGTALFEASPVQMFGPEHTNAGHHGWVCTGVPVLDGGTPVGAFTLSGPLVSAHPHTLSLVTAVAVEAGRYLEEQRRIATSHTGSLAPQQKGPHLVVDRQGRVCRAIGLAPAGPTIPVHHLAAGGTVWVDGAGPMSVAPWTHGWILTPSSNLPTSLAIDPGPPASAEIHSAAGPTRLRLTHRQLQLLTYLAEHPDGVDTRAIAHDLYRDAAPVTVRAELSRLRRRLGPVIDSRPYRLTLPATFRNSSL